MLERSLCVLATLFAGTTATAQYWRPDPINSLSIDPQPVANETVAGNLTGHHCPDLAVRLGTQIVLCTAPSIHNARTPIASWVDANGLATVPGGGDEGRDALAIATSTGLVQWKRDATSCTTIDAGVDWRTVACGDLDGAGPVDFVGVIGNDRLRFVLRTDTSVTCSETVLTGQTIASVVLAQWNDTGPLEVCAATEQRLWVGTPTATLRQLVLANDGSSCLARLRATSRDHLAWSVRVGGEPRLYGVSRLGQSMTVATGLANATQLAAGNIDASGGDDLLLTGPSMMPKLVLNWAEPTANAPSFDVANMSSLAPPMDPQPIVQRYSAPWCGDIDSDGRDDAFLPWQTTNPSNVTSATFWLYMNAYGLEPRPRLPFGSPAVTVTGSPTERTFTVHVSPSFPAPTEPVVATHLELLVFAARPDNGVLALVPDGLMRVTAALPLANDSISFTVPVTVDMPRAFSVVLRWVQLSGTTVLHDWTSTLVTFAYDGDVIPHTMWREARGSEAVPAPLFWPPPAPPAPQLYFLRPLDIPGGGIYTSSSGDEEPPDLPPPTPPKPPVPPGP